MTIGRGEEDMAFTLFGLLEATLLVLNGLAVLNRERFLKKWGMSAPVHSFDAPAGGSSVKQQFVSLVLAVQTVMRMPLIFVNIAVILKLLLLG